ncbi:MAG: hypothetical protein JRJ49_05650 [Deltaproteobacteria bacterium]|nr:hypothetical protein [Deltaproteobacteria bacterium]
MIIKIIKRFLALPDKIGFLFLHRYFGERSEEKFYNGNINKRENEFYMLHRTGWALKGI